MKNNIYKIFFCTTCLFYFIFFVVNERVLAVGDVSSIIEALKTPPQDNNPYAIFDLGKTIINDINGLGLMPIVALLTMMYAGIMYIFAGGDPKKTESAVKLLNTATIGFALSLVLLSLWNFIRALIGT